MRKPDEIDLPMAVKLASLVIHCKEALSPAAHPLDQEAIRGIVFDGEIRRWLKSFDPALLPVKR